MSDHIHDCSGPDATCPCGFKLVIPPVCVDFSVTRWNPDTRKNETLVSDGFNCEDASTAARALRRAADTLDRDGREAGKEGR